VDIVVVGGALAGFTTALHAHELGASVVVLEKAAQVGGTARKAVAGMWGSEQPVHAAGRGG